MKFTLSIMAMAALANAHGYFQSPGARQPGKEYENSCGMQAYYNMQGSINGNVQGLEQVVANQPDYNPKTCNLWKCKGMKYADNTANVQKYTAGQTVDLHFNIAAPHTGVANVTIIDLSTPVGTVLSTLKTWDVYASNSVPTQDSQEHFSVKMPSNLGNKCAQGGKCAIQMNWDAHSIDQTYQSCIDFTLGGGAAKRHARDFSVAGEEEE